MNERDIFIAVLQQPTPEARRAYFDRACGGDEALRRRLQALLDAHGRAGNFLEPPTAAPPPTGAGVSPEAATAEGAERPGTVIGPYKLLQAIGEGGMGAVFMAEQTEPVRRKVALKLIKPGMDSGQVVARFEAERQALALMDHPNIARVFDGGTTASGRPYFVMELVRGVPITKYCDEHRLTPRQRLELFIPVCEAVQHAHQKGVIHRDLKPSNVLVALYDGKPVPKVIDFGVAKAAGQPLTERTLFTALGSVVGTLEYMSPEQAQMNQLDIDTRSDVYSLGVMLYELLTGTTPLERKRLKGAGLLEVLRVIREEEPPRPSTRLSTAEALPAIATNRGLEPKKLTGLVRGELDWIVMKCLEKDRRRRYEHANGLAQDLGRYLHDEPVQAHPPGAGYRLKKFLRRHGGPVLAAAVVLLALVGGVIGTSWGMAAAEQAHQAEARQRAAAEQERDGAKQAEAHATAARNEAVEARDNERGASYAADTLLASRALTDGPLSRAVDLLDSWLPERRDGQEYRGREWHMLRRLCDASEKTLVGHEGPLRALAWSADGRRLASGGADRVVRVWDAETGRCLQTLVGHAGGVFDLAFSPDGKRLASASADGTVRLWDVDSGQERFVLRGHILPVYAVAFHPDGRRFASAGGDGVVKVWDATNGAELFTLQGHDAPVGRLQFDAAGKKLASCGIVGGTIFWDLDTRTAVNRLNRSGDVVFTPDLGTGAFVLPGGEFGVFDVKAKTLNQGDIGLRGIRALDVGRNARVVAVAGTDDAIHVLDRDRLLAIATLRGHAGAARRLALRPDGRKLASAGDDGAVRLWDLPDPDVPAPYAGFHEHNVTAVAFSRDGALLASGDYLGTIAVWDARTGKRVLKLGSHFLRRESQPTPLEIGTGKPLDKEKTFLKSYTQFAAGPGARDPIVDCYTSQGHGGEVRAVAFTPDNKTLVSAGAQDFIIWDLASGKPLKEVRHPTLLSSLALSPDGTLAATGCWDNVVRVFRVPSGELVKELEGHGDNVMCVAFHPSGKQLASGGRDRTILVWDLETGAVKHRLLRHANTVSALLYSPDGKRLVSGGLDQAIHVWDAQTGEYEATLHGHTEGVTSLAFSADGKWLVSASDGNDDTSARVWLWNSGRFRPGALIPAVSSRGPTAVAVHPVTGDLLVGRQQLTTFETRPFAAAPPVAAGPAPARMKAPADDRLSVLGYALVDEISVWPGGEKGRLRPGRPGGKFLVVAASLPFGRVRIGDADYRRLMDLNRQDEDSPAPLKFSSILTRPGRFVLSGADGKPAPADFAGDMGRSEEDGFEFMPKGRSLLENLTATPQADARELVYLGWEVARDFSAADLRLRFEDDDPVEVPPLVLETFRPDKPFHPATRDFEADEGGSRLRSNATRFPGP